MAQVGGAASRLLAGVVSDRLGRRPRPMRVLAGTSAGVVATLAPATPPVVALAVGGAGYPLAFATVAVFPLVVTLVIPVLGERRAAVAAPAQSSSPRGAGAPPNIMSHRVR